VKTNFDAAGTARKRSSRIQIPNSNMKPESDSQRRLGLPPAAHQEPTDAREGAKIVEIQ